MLSQYIKSKTLLYSLISDLIILSGVVFFHWNSQRIVGFFCLEVEIMIVFFFVYLVLIKNIFDPITFLLGLTVLSLLMFGYFLMMYLMLNPHIGKNNDPTNEELIGLFFPYYDAAFFILLCSISQIHIIIRLRQAADKRYATFFQIKSIAYRMLIVPLAPLIAVILSLVFQTGIAIGAVMAFMVIKNVFEYWRYKAFVELRIADSNA